MNHIYRTVFNRALGVCQVASELATGNGKAGQTRAASLLGAVLLAGAAGNAAAVDINTVYTNNSGDLIHDDGGGIITQSAPLLVDGTTTLTNASNIILTNANNDFQGVVNATADYIAIRDVNNLVIGTLGLNPDSFLSLVAGGQLTFNQAVNTGASSVTLASDGGALNLANAVQGNTVTLRGSTGMTLSGPIISNSGITLTSSGPVLVSGVIAGTGSLNLGNSGITRLTAANTYQGGTNLSAGTLVVGNSAALGTGTLTASTGTRLDADSAITLANNVTLNGNLTLLDDLTLNGVIGGTGTLIKSGSGLSTLNGANLYTGTTALTSGGLVLGSNSALGTGAVNVSNGTSLSANTAITIANNFNLGGTLSVEGSNDLTITGRLAGIAGLQKNGAGTLTLNGANTYFGNTTLNAGTLTLGDAGALGSGNLVVGGASTLDNSAAFGIGSNITLNAGLTVAGSNDLSLNGLVSGAGSLTKNGLSDLTLAGNNTFTGALNIVSGSITTLNANALGSTSGVNISAGAGLNLASDASAGALSGSGSVQLLAGNTLTIGGVNGSSTFDGDIGGAGNFTKVGTGTLNLTGVNGITGNTQINDGTLDLSGSLGSTQVIVGNGGALTGTGSVIGTLTVSNGGHLVLSSGNTLSAGGLVLAANSNVDVALSTPSPTSLLNVGGNLTLDGNLNASDAGGFGVGLYRLINYTGALTDLGLDVTAAPSGYALGDLVVQTNAPNQVNLLVSAPNANIRFWDGSQAIPNGSVDGGSGTWNSGSTNWISVDGVTNQTWASDFAVFQGAAGTVTVSGTQAFTGLQFVTDGYTLTGGQLTAVNGANGATAVRVDPGVTATIASTINGTGMLSKLDSGALVLSGANTYTGGTSLAGGRLIVGSNTALGTGTLTTAAGTRLDSNAAISLGNAITLNGNLILDGSNALTLGGAVGGTGGLIKNGSAGLTLNGNNTFLGPIALNAGTLTVGSNTALGGGTLNASSGTALDSNTAVTLGNNVNLAGSLAVVGTHDLGLTGNLNGAGSLTKHGAGDLTLGGSNNYLGGTTLNAGQLTVGSNSALGLGTLTVAGAAALDTSGAYSLGNNIVLNANLTVAGSNNLTAAGVISGTGGLVKDGAANLTLNGANTYQGGTTVNAGTLTLGNAGALGGGALTVAGQATLDNLAPLTLANNLTVNAQLTLTGNNNLTLAGILAGAGTVIKNGLSTLTLSGSNTFTGDLNVQGGALTLTGTNALGTANLNVGTAATVQVAGNSTFDALTGDGDLTIGAPYTLSAGASNANSVYDGDLTGSGSFSKLGTGKLVLNGNSVLNGVTNVTAGSLIIGGASGSSASLTSDVDVANGATLGGHGTITGDVDVANGGSLAPGNSIGTLSVVGNVTLAAGSLFEVEANPDGTSDRLTATGDVTLNGATLSLIAANGAWAPSTSYTIISANNVIGTFAAPIVSNLAFLDANVDYSSGNSVVLNLVRNNVTFNSVAVTDNQVASASALQSLGAGNALNVAVAGLSAAGAQAAYDSLSGELHASVQSALLDDSRYLREGLNQRLLAAQGLIPGSGVLNASADGPTFWLQGYGGWARNDGDGNAARLDHDSKGTLFGADIALGDTWRVGAAVGLGTSDIDENDRDSSADADSQSVALYASATWDHVNLRAGAGRTWNEIDSRRAVSVGALNEREKASYDATVSQVFSELGYRLTVDPLQLEPFIGLAHVRFDGDSFHEKGGSASLSGNGEKQDITYSTLGLRGSVPLAQVAGLPVSAQGALSWQHAFGGDTPDSRLAFTGGDSFQVQGTPMERNSALAELGVQAQVAANTTVGLTYSGRFGEDYRDNGVRLALSVGF